VARPVPVFLVDLVVLQESQALLVDLAHRCLEVLAYLVVLVVRAVLVDPVGREDLERLRRPLKRQERISAAQQAQRGMSSLLRVALL
jgi:hypothetical protein